MQIMQAIKPPSPPPKRESRISKAKSGQLKSATRWLMYGPEGVGKSSLGADSASPIFLDVEDSSKWIDVARYSYHDGSLSHLPRTYQDVIDAVEDLTTSKHNYKTVVIDTVDALEALMHRAVCKKHNKPSIEAFGYGKGYNVATDEWRLLLDQLNRLVGTGVDVILLGHSHVKAYKNPTGEDYDRFQLRMHEKVASATKEWCDAVGFLRYEEGGAKLLGDDSLNARARGYSTKSRILSFDRDAAWDAKSRLPLPASITIDAQHPWRPLQAAIAASELITDDDLRTAIDAELLRIGDVIITPSKSRIEVATVRADVTKGDRSLLARTLNFLRGIEPQSTETETVTGTEGNQ